VKDLKDFRCFAPSTKAVDEAWPKSALSNDTWTNHGLSWKTNTGPVSVVNSAGLVGVMKPVNNSPTNPQTAATEKIVADLAFAIGLPVPPVTLWDRGASVSPRYVAISAWAYDNFLTWGQAAPALTPNQKAELLPWASAMLPFEAWISAQDRTNEGNVLIGVSSSGELLGAWIDYAFSLDYAWKGASLPHCQIPPIYPPVGAVSEEAMVEVSDRIIGLENGAIEGIVNRIPSECLPRVTAENIIRNLVSRRIGVRGLFPGGQSK
jgi:hypothetical protein